MSVRRMLEAAQVILPVASRGVAVLGYHLIGAGTSSPVDIPEDEFRRQMLFLRTECDVRSLDDVLSVGPERGKGPPVVLTFDDAYLNFRKVAWPILTELALPATLYVPVGFVNGAAGCPIRGTALEPCGWKDLVALSTEGASIGSHTVSHINLTRVSHSVVERELEDSRTELEQRLGVAVRSFCYPRAKWSDRVVGQVAGVYESAVIAGGRRYVRDEDDRHRIPRFPVRRDLTSFESMLRARIWLGEAIADMVRQRRS